jgi:predicted ATPase
MALIATEGYGSASAEHNFTRASKVLAELSDPVGPSAASDYEKEFVTTWGVWAYHLVRSQLDAAHRSADQLHALATRTKRSDFQLEAHVARGQNYFYFAADHPRALSEFEAALDKYEATAHVHHAVRFGQDPKAVTVAVVIWIDAMTGKFESAEKRLAAGLEHTRKRGHPFSEAYLASHAAALYYLVRDDRSCREHAERAIAVSERYGFPTWLAVGAMYRGWARGVQGEAEAGLNDIQSHLGIFGPIGLSLYGPTRLEILSQAQELCGDMQGASASVAEALECAERTGELWYQAELERRRGELLIRLEQPRESVEASLQRALKLAQQQGNRLFELRTAVTLVRWQLDRLEARRLLEVALEPFPAHSVMADVREARVLLSADFRR